MAHFFDDDARVGLVRHFLDSNWHQRKSSMKGKNRKTLFHSSISEKDGEGPISQNGDCLSLSGSGWSDACMEKSGESVTAVGPWEEQLVTSEQEKHASIGCERHLSSLESLNIEDRVSELEKRLGSVDLLNLPNRVAKLEDLGCLSARKQNVDSQALDKQQQGEHDNCTSLTSSSIENHQLLHLDIKVSELNTALIDVRRYCNLRASQLVVLLNQELSALSKKVSEQLGESFKDMSRRLEALDGDLSVRYLTIKETIRESARTPPRGSVQSSPRGRRQATTQPSLDVQAPPPSPATEGMQSRRPAELGGIHPCLSSALSPSHHHPCLSSTLTPYVPLTPGRARGRQVVEPCREATEEATPQTVSLSF